MNRNIVMALMTGALVGVPLGWIAKPSPPLPSERTSRTSAQSDTKRSQRDDAAALEKSRVSQRWIDRIEKDGAAAVSKEIPADDMEALLEKMMGSMWGLTSREKIGELVDLMETWASQDPEGALKCARALQVPQQREIALTGVASAVGKNDPAAGFEIYTEIGVMTVSARGEGLEPMFRKLFQDAAEKGVDALVDISQRMPRNKTNGLMTISIEYPENFDFEKFMDRLAVVTSNSGNFELMKAYQLSNALGKWAMRDPDAAFDYAVTRSAQGQRMDLDDITTEMERGSGSQEAHRWLGEKLGTLSSAQAAILLPKSGLLNSPESLRKTLATMPEESAAMIRFQALQAYPSSMAELLLDIPSVDDRVAVIGNLRGVKEPQMLAAYLKKWQLPQERVDELIRTVGQATN